MPEKKEENKEEKQMQQRKDLLAKWYPDIPFNAVFDSEIATLDTSETDPLLAPNKLQINFFASRKQYGHISYMSKESAEILARGILKVLGKE